MRFLVFLTWAVQFFLAICLILKVPLARHDLVEITCLVVLTGLEVLLRLLIDLDSWVIKDHHVAAWLLLEICFSSTVRNVFSYLEVGTRRHPLPLISFMIDAIWSTKLGTRFDHVFLHRNLPALTS